MENSKKTRYFHVDILCVLFGIGTWLCVNGLWVELPLLVQSLPEKWTLPSYMAVIIQIANLGPISYTILNSFFPSIVTEKRSIYFVMGVGLAASVLLAQYWMEQVEVFGNPRSVALLVLVLVLASVDCSSRVLYLPFMGSFKPEYLTSYFIGEGLSGFIPSVVALVQGSGGTPECVNITIPPENNTISVLSTPEPLFSVAVFFYFMAVMSIVSAIAFHLLNVNSVVRNCTVDLHSVTEERDFNLQSSPVKFYNSTPIVKPEDVALCDKVDDMELEQVESSNICQSEAVYQTTDTSALSSAEFAYLMVLLTIICGLSNGIFPAIQSYSALPYGHAAYHWTVALSNMANPGVCFLMLLGKTPDKSIASVIAVPAFIVSTYVLYSALRSPYPPLVGSSLGIILLVLSWVLLVGLFTYVKVLIATVMRGSGGKKGLFWTGAYTQLGSTFGAIIAFLLINVGNVFQSFNPCA